MKAKVPSWIPSRIAGLARLAGILSNLAHHLEKGYVNEYSDFGTTEIIHLERACRWLGVSARYCRESLWCFWLAARSVGRWLKTLPIAFFYRVHRRLSFHQPPGHNSHSWKTRSCVPENTSKEGLSNAKNVDVKDRTYEDSERCPSPSKTITKIKSNGERMCALLPWLFASTGIGGPALLSGLGLRDWFCFGLQMGVSV